MKRGTRERPLTRLKKIEERQGTPRDEWEPYIEYGSKQAEKAANERKKNVHR